jgi:hypothetical protein
VDGLIVVDLLQTSPKILRRYMGNEIAEVFLKYHGILEQAPPPTPNS